MAFAHDVAGGGGNLIAVSVHSPNFVHGSTGWAIRRDGSAEFHDIIIPAGSGGAIVTFAPAAPPSPNIGDVWYDTSNGLLEHQWDGSAWVPFQIGTGAIASGAVTGTQLAASVTARSLGGITTTISGTAPGSPAAGDIWINSSNGYQLSQYSGTSFVAIQWTGTDVISASTITGSLIAASTITGGEIAAGTITASNIAAGTIVAGIVNGTTITGGTLIADGASGGAFVYSSAPAAGNMIASIAGTAGTDGFGNAYPAGIQSVNAAGQGTHLTGTQLIFVGSQFAVGGGSDAYLFAPPATSASTQGTLYAVSPTDADYQTILRLVGESEDGTQAPFAAIFRFNNTTQLASGGVPLGLSDVPAVPSGVSGGLLMFSSGQYLQLTGNGFLGPVTAIAPGTAATPETWHTITLDANWSTSGQTPAYRLLPDGSVQVKGQVTHTTGIAATGVAINSGHPLPAAYRPSSAVFYKSSDTNRAGILAQTTGVLTAFGNGTVTLAELTGIYWPGS